MSHRGQSMQLAVEIDGTDVSLTVRCRSHYEAMSLYDRLTVEAANGYVKLEIAARGNEHMLEPDPS